MQLFYAFIAGFVSGLVVWAFFAAKAKAAAAKAEADYLALKSRIKKASVDLGGPGGTQPPPPAA